MQCWNCNAENEEGYAACWFCKEPSRPTADPPGGLENRPADDDPHSARHVVLRTETVERHLARSPEDLPPEIRERMRQMQIDSSVGRTQRRYTYRGPDGRPQTYASLDEMPPDVRAMFERGPVARGPGTHASRRMERTNRVPPFGTSAVPDDDASFASSPGNTFAFWAGGVLAAGLLIGLGLAGLISLPIAGTADASPGLLGVPLSGAARGVVGAGCLLIGGLLHVCLFWVNPARRHRRIHGFRLLLTCVLAAFLLGNLHLLTALFGAYRID